MGEYRVYKVGEDEHVRRSQTAPAPGGARRARRGAAKPTAPRRWWLWALVAVGVAVAATLYWLYGREAIGNSRAALDIAKLSGKVPDWAVVAAPVAVVAAVALATVCLTFGRHLAVKLAAVAVVVLVLATPGLAVGYANGLVDDVGGGTGSAARTDEELAEIAAADEEIERPLPDKPMNILLIGSDKSDIPGDPGRSDTQMLVRLDPETKSISMLSLPRDLYVDIPGYGYDKMNTAYSYGGPKLVIKTFKQLTGLPVNAWIETDFAGFWHVVNILGGVYLPIDHKYFVPASAAYKSINLEPGYQLVRGKQALNYVRFRHDEFFDFGRMQRQQLFLRELQRQSGRWSSDWERVVRLIKAITSETKSSVSSLAKLGPLVELSFEVDTSKVHQAHLEGASAMINGASIVEAAPEQVAEVVDQFTHPTRAPVPTKGATKVGKKAFTVHVYNGSGIDGLATSAATQLASQGYRAEAVADAYEYPDAVTAVYASSGLEAHAEAIAAMMGASDVRVVERIPGGKDGVTVFVASSFDGVLDIPEEQVEEQQQTLLKNQKVDWATWQQTDADTPLRLQAPTAWPSGSTYDQFRNYSIKTTEGKRGAASVVVARTPQYGYWSIQAMRWMDPPAIENPSGKVKSGGRTYLLFYQGTHLHMVAWKERGTLYWLLNTLTNQLSNDLMMGLAKSCKPVK
jgi:LCP family protein required for cell wall assembly